MTITQIAQTIEETEALKTVAEAFTEIAALKLQKIRTGIERNRVFFQEILQVFRAVKIIAEKKGIIPLEKQKGTLSILLTSNHRFYGPIEEHLVDFFTQNSSEFKTDRIVVGKTAGEILRAKAFPHPYNEILFETDIPHAEEINTFVPNLINYHQILVYYSRMKSILVQEPHVVNLLQKPPQRILDDPKHHFDYFFEPHLAEILKYFDNQITALLLEQTILESELARTASRLVTMDQAQGNASDLLKKERRIYFAAKKSLDHFRLLDTIASLVVQRRGYSYAGE